VETDGFEIVDIFRAVAHSQVRALLIGRQAFDDVWVRSQVMELGPGVTVRLPCLDDLIRTKRFGGRPRDAEDIRLLERLRARGRT
jgi:hypothetical protein